jgi:hypothetical protein
MAPFTWKKAYSLAVSRLLKNKIEPFSISSNTDEMFTLFASVSETKKFVTEDIVALFSRISPAPAPAVVPLS